MNFRPAGELPWALRCSVARRWHLLGCLSTEARCLSTLRYLYQTNLCEAHKLVCVRERSSPDADEASRLIDAHILDCRTFAGEPNVYQRNLSDQEAVFNRDAVYDERCSVVLDITCMPKRFFFVYLKALLRNPFVEDLIITYCLGRYAEGALSGNPDAWAVLPSFRPPSRIDEEKAKRRLAVNVGFMPGGLQAHLSSDDSEKEVHLLLPFPARVSSIRRVWKSAMQIDRDWKGDAVHIHRVGANDVSGAFDTIARLGQSGPISLAPFGPKPISAAMCIYATLTGSPVYYAQPKWYSPNYTIGPELNAQGEPMIHAYWIKHRSELLYQL